MKPIEFPEHNVVYAKDQPEYQPLPVFKSPDGVVVSCWELTPEEIEEVKKSGKVWLSVMTFNKPLQPVFLSALKKDVLIVPEKEPQVNLSKLRETVNKKVANLSDHDWIKAFEIYNKETNRNLGMRCGMCYNKVLEHFAAKAQ